MDRILIIGAAGQIGSELTVELRKIYGSDNVFATDIKEASPDIMSSGPFQLLDVMDDKRLIHFIIRHKITQIYHLAAVLSGNAEKLPLQAWHINMDGLMNILEVAKMVDEVKKVFWPSSIFIISLGAEPRPVSDVAYVWGMAIITNILLYLLLAFFVSLVMKLHRNNTDANQKL